MPSSVGTKLVNFIALICIIGSGWYLYLHRERAMQVFFPQKPCTKPIAYSIASIDPRFQLSTSTLMAHLEQSSGLWSSATGKTLFAYDPNGSLRINFIYDDRQAATDRLKSLGYNISNDRESYDQLKPKYDALKTSLAAQKTDLDRKTDTFNQRSKAYETQVNEWNEKGGAPKEIFEKLKEEQAELKKESERLSSLLNTYNKQIEELNDLVNVINRIADALNIKAEEANDITKSRKGEFEEGEYVYDNGDTRINIYEFDSKERLIRVLAHEFGHALGIDHVDDPEAVMYYLNQKKSITLTETDMEALIGICSK